MYQPLLVIAALRSFSAVSCSAPVEPRALPSEPWTAGSVACCRFANPPTTTPATKPAGLLPTPNGPKASGWGGAAGESGGGGGGGEELVGRRRRHEVQRDADLLPLLLDRQLVSRRLAEHGDVDLQVGGT